MKTRYNIIILLITTVLCFSCNDDFMQQDDPQKPSEGAFLTNTQELEVYLNGLYHSYIAGHQKEWAADANDPFGYNGSPLMYGDFFSDNLVSRGAKSNDRLSGKWNFPNDGEGTGWKWKDLKTINYFLRNYRMAEGSVNSPDELNKYAAEAYFFKAWDYFNKVKLFGDVPWYSSDLTTESEELYAPRTPRAEVMDSVLYCINYAVEYINDTDNPIGRINRDMANFLKARICLYEGTFRKYHTELNLQATAEKFLRASAEASKAIMDTKRYDLFTGNRDNSGKDNSYWKLFALSSREISGNKEIILARYYDGSKETSGGHAAQRYYEINRDLSSRPPIGATRGLVDEYLCEDGRPIYIEGTEGNYTLNPLFKGYDGLWTELENRDPRLTQTICYPGEYISVWSQTYPVLDPQMNGIVYPAIGYNENIDPGGTTVTGYRVIKHWMANDAEYKLTTTGTQTGIEFRYAEVLLNYAEAKYELGELTQDIVDETINKLRERAGFNFAKYPTAKLVIGQEPADPRLDKIYADKLNYPVSPLLREIRRERRVEFASENRRYEDLMRWSAGNLMSVPLRGMKFSEVKQKLYDGTNVLPKDVTPPYDVIPKIATKALAGTDVFLDEDGFLIAYPKSTYFDNGIIPWENFRYYWPIPIKELELNPNLVQNPGWRGVK